MRQLISISAIIVLLLAFGSTVISAQSATRVANGFYAKINKLNIRGLPDASQLRAISLYLSPDIISLIKRNQKYQAVFIKERPNEKPPWIEGDLFSSLFEGVTSHRVGRTRSVNGSTHIDINLDYSDGINFSKWTDIAILKKIGGKWRITNIVYTGNWPFKSGTSLLNVLK